MDVRSLLYSLAEWLETRGQALDLVVVEDASIRRILMSADLPSRATIFPRLDDALRRHQ